MLLCTRQDNRPTRGHFRTHVVPESPLVYRSTGGKKTLQMKQIPRASGTGTGTHNGKSIYIKKLQ